MLYAIALGIFNVWLICAVGMYLCCLADAVWTVVGHKKKWATTLVNQAGG